MHFNIDTVIGMAIGSGGLGVAAGLNYVAGRLPGWLMAKAKAKFAADVAAGKIDAATARMLRAQAQALFAWADAELPQTPGDRKMDEVLARLQQLPGVGLMIKADPADARKILETEYAAWRAEIAKDAAPAATAA